MRSHRSGLLLLAAAAAVAIRPPIATAQPAAASPGVFSIDQKVEVREGDKWSPATVIGKEGRRIQIKYDDGTDEWVTGDRIRAASGGGATPATPAAGANDDKPAANPADNRQFAPKTTVEVKSNNMWRKATVTNRRGAWHLVAYDIGNRLEWVEPWRIRDVGDTTYDVDFAGSNPNVRSVNDNTPKPRPDPAPKPGTSASAKNDPFAPATVDWPITPIDRAAMTDVKPAADVAWSYPPPADHGATTRPAFRFTSRNPIPMSNVEGGAGMRIQAGGVDVNGRIAMFVYNSGDISGVEILDMGNGRISFRGEMPDKTYPLSVTPDGKRVITRARGFFPGTRGRVDVWDMPTSGLSAAAAAKPKHVVSFNPYADASSAGRSEVDVVAAIAIDADRLVTANGTGLICGFKIGPGSVSAVWQCQLEARGATDGSVEISPDRRTIAVSGSGAITLLDALTGQIRGTISTGGGALTSVRFRGDGKRLAGMRGTVLSVFDLESGRQLVDLALPKALTTPPASALPGQPPSPPTTGGDTEVRWLSGDLVYLTASGALFNFKDNTVLGVYRLPNSKGETTIGDRLVASIKPSNDDRKLVSWDLASMMPPNARLASPKALVPVTSGAETHVSIDVSGLQTDDATKTAILDSLARQLTARGWTEDPSARIRLVARTENGRSEQRTYEQRGIGQPIGGEQTQVTVTEKITRMSVEIDGKPVWDTHTASMAGSFVQLREGQSMQEAVDAQSRGDAGFLRNVALPETLFEPMESLPSSTPVFDLMPNGVRMAQQ